MVNIEELAWNLINTIEGCDATLGAGDRCVEENEAIGALKDGLQNLPTYATCYTPFGKKWNLSTVIEGEYKEEVVCIAVVFSDNQCIVELDGDKGFVLLNMDDLAPWVRVNSVNTKKENI